MPSEQSHLKRMILSQSVEGTVVPVLLFGDDTLAGGDPAAEHPEAVTRAAQELGLDLGAVELFSYDAYRLQSALGDSVTP